MFFKINIKPIKGAVHPVIIIEGKSGKVSFIHKMFQKQNLRAF